MSLLDKAKGVKFERKVNKEVNHEEIELLIAVLRNEVSYTQACTALGYSPQNRPGSYYAWHKRTVAAAIRIGKLKIVDDDE